MNLTSLKKSQLKVELFQLIDEVTSQLKHEKDVDTFLDKTTLFDPWESVLPEAVYPIFVLTVLNNIRKESVVDVIVNSILGIDQNSKPLPAKNSTKKVDHVAGHPFN